MASSYPNIYAKVIYIFGCQHDLLDQAFEAVVRVVLSKEFITERVGKQQCDRLYGGS